VSRPVAGAVVLALSTVGVYAFKAAGPLLLGGRRLPGRVQRFTELAPGALLGAMVVVATVGQGRGVALDARAAGVAAAAVLLWRRSGFVTSVGGAVVVTALVRALG
jgi:branched-subunit amino acid transport protein